MDHLTYFIIKYLLYEVNGVMVAGGKYYNISMGVY